MEEDGTKNQSQEDARGPRADKKKEEIRWQGSEERTEGSVRFIFEEGGML